MFSIRRNCITGRWVRDVIGENEGKSIKKMQEDDRLNSS